MLRGLLSVLLLLSSLGSVMLLHLISTSVAVGGSECDPPAVTLYTASYFLLCSAVLYFFIICLPLLRTLLRKLCNLHLLPPLLLAALSVYQLVETLNLKCQLSDYLQVTSFASCGSSIVLVLIESLTLKERRMSQYKTVEEE